MQKIYLFLYVLIIAILITFYSTKVTYYDPPFTCILPRFMMVCPYDEVRGFPFELERNFAPSTEILKSSQAKYPINPYLLTFIFWFSGSLAFLLWLRKGKRKEALKALIIVSIITFLFMFVDLKTGDCLSGYPIGFISNCIDVISPNNPQWFFAILNYSFWLVTTLVGTLVFLNAKNSTIRLVKLFIPPLILTLFSLAFQFTCQGFFACLSGRGFPIPFTSDGTLVIFGIDYIFWWIVYYLILHIKRKQEITFRLL